MTIKRAGHRYIDTESGHTIDIWYPRRSEQARRGCLAEKLGLIQGELFEIEINSLASPPQSTEDVYLRLHMLSERAIKPNEVNLTKIYSLLPTVAWTSAGPVFPERVELLRSRVADEYHQLVVSSIDKFPRMTDYVIPADVRIADTDRVRLGAYLAPGTSIMHKGFVNFNSGTLGNCTIDGRLGPGVVVGKNSDVGAGATITGNQSGSSKQINYIGERSLLGANAGIGIAVGDDCVVEAGLFVTAATIIKTEDGEYVPARKLSGKSGLLFRRNSQTGAIEVFKTS
ncbi:MAG: DapH/DapD/GlmU-related protein [Gammaproteobacteria bacterium]